MSKDVSGVHPSDTTFFNYKITSSTPSPAIGTYLLDNNGPIIGFAYYWRINRSNCIGKHPVMVFFFFVSYVSHAIFKNPFYFIPERPAQWNNYWNPPCQMFVTPNLDQWTDRKYVIGNNWGWIYDTNEFSVRNRNSVNYTLAEHLRNTLMAEQKGDELLCRNLTSTRGRNKSRTHNTS